MEPRHRARQAQGTRGTGHEKHRVLHAGEGATISFCRAAARPRSCRRFKSDEVHGFGGFCCLKRRSWWDPAAGVALGGLRLPGESEICITCWPASKKTASAHGVFLLTSQVDESCCKHPVTCVLFFLSCQRLMDICSPQRYTVSRLVLLLQTPPLHHFKQLARPYAGPPIQVRWEAAAAFLDLP
jgi:hypothetical protein